LELGPHDKLKNAQNRGFVRNIDMAEAAPRVSVVIPTYNEALNLPIVFARLPEVFEIIVVDGRSLDDTVAVARRLKPSATIITQSRQGKGNALACGFAKARGDVIVMLDADGSADPREIPRFVRALVEGADFAKGSRFSVGGGSGDITRLRRIGNRALSGLVNATHGTRYSDLCYGYNAFWRSCLPAMGLESALTCGQMHWGDGFEVETLINLRIARAGLRVVEVPSYEAERIHGVSNLNALTDGMRVLRTIAAERRRRSPIALANLIPPPTEIGPTDVFDPRGGDIIDLMRPERRPNSCTHHQSGGLGLLRSA
jgi:glycosyltransferase involved in cell wall biosynthesis